MFTRDLSGQTNAKNMHIHSLTVGGAHGKAALCNFLFLTLAFKEKKKLTVFSCLQTAVNVFVYALALMKNTDMRNALRICKGPHTVCPKQFSSPE